MTSHARQITPATGKLGVLTPGMGAVASTFIAGVSLPAKAFRADRIGSQMAHIRLGTQGGKPQPADQGVRAAR